MLYEKMEVWEAVNFLKSNATIKFESTATEDDAKVLGDILISIYHPPYNTPLKNWKKANQYP